jgi:L-ascorbate metabolism protein UlaG (beta-lactamase superfamily)
LIKKNEFARKPYWTRRAVLAGTGFGAVAALLYGISPSFWDRYASDLKRQVSPPPEIPDPAQWPDDGLHAAWIGHATVLLKCNGLTILTDPIFSERAGISLGPVTLGVKRLIAPALKIGSVPKVDLILLSHAHMDHFDIPSLRRLESRRTTVVTADSTTDLLRPERYAKVHEMHWGETLKLSFGTVRAFEVNHWGSRLRSDSYRGYNGYLLEIGRHRVLFAGDTAMTRSFQALHSARPIDLAIMPIGCYNPWRRNHCTPEEAWRMGNDAGSNYFIPVHHQTFTLSREPGWEPLSRFLSVAHGEKERVAIRRIGQEWHG